MQAITTKYIGPRNVLGSRVKAHCQARSITIPWDDAWNCEQHRCSDDTYTGTIAMARSDADALVNKLVKKQSLIESTATDIIAAIREHGPTRDVIVPRLQDLADALRDEAFDEGYGTALRDADWAVE